MEIARLEAQITGDVKPLVAALDTAKSEISQFAQQGAVLFTPLTAGLSNTAKAALAAGQDIRSLTAALDVLQAEQSGIIRGTTLWQLYETEIKKVNAQLNILEAELPVVAAEMKTVGTSATGSFAGIGKGLTSAFSGLKQIAYILPGLGIAGIFNLAFEAIAAAADELGIFGEKTKEADEATQELAKSMDSFNESAAKELLHARELLIVIADGNSAYGIRQTALKKVRDEYGPYLKNLSDEDLLTGNIKNALDEINKALLSKLALQAGEEKIIALLKQRFDLTQKIVQAEETQLTTAGFANSLKNATGNAKALGVQLQASVEQSVPGLFKMKDTVHDIDVQVEFLINSLKRVISESAGLTVGDDTAPAKLKKQVEALQIALRDLKEPWRRFANDIAVETGDALAPVDRTLDKMAQIQTKPFDFLKALQDIDLKNFNKQFEKIQDVVSEVAHTITRIFVDIATTGKISFRDLAREVINFAAKLGEAVLEAVLLKAVMSALGLTASAGAGGLAASILSALALSGIAGNAEGGIFAQPTLIGNQLFGEAGPEALIPLDRLSDMIGSMGGTQRIVVEGKLSGNVITLVQNRQNIRNNRNYGSNFNN